MARKPLLFAAAAALLLLSGCQKETSEIIDLSQSMAESTAEGSDTQNDEMAADGAMLLELGGAQGNMTYELLDAWVTQTPGASGVDQDCMDEYSFIYMSDTEVPWPDYFKDETMEELIDGCQIFVCRIRVTNVDAISDYEDYYGDPYIFRADNLFLNYIDTTAESSQYPYLPVAYYSLRQEGEFTWSTYELSPGESLTYDVGFVVGDSLPGMDGEMIPIDIENLYLGSASGSVGGTYYKVDWEER